MKPLPGLKELNSGLAAKEGYPTAYVATSIYDFGDEDDRRAAEPWVTRTISGRLVGDEVDPATYRMCYNTDWWQQRIEDVCATAVRDAGFKGVYLDTFGRWSTRCYAAQEHGHSRGGGRQGTAGMHRLAERVRKRIRAIDADAVMTAEAPIEYFIDVLDGRLLSMSIHRDHCPIFSAVYHDYITFYGRTVSAYPDRPGLLRLKLANQFVMGAQLGRIFIHDQRPLLFEPQYRDELSYLRRLAAHKRAAVEFLSFGKMLRPVKSLTPLPTLSAKHWYRDHTVTLPAVVTSSWLAADGRVAIVFTNAGEQRLSFTYQLNTEDYGFRPGKRLQIAQLTPHGLSQGLELPLGTAPRKETLDGLGVAVYVISDT